MPKNNDCINDPELRTMWSVFLCNSLNTFGSCLLLIRRTNRSMIDLKACFMDRLIIDTPNMNKSLDLSEG